MQTHPDIGLFVTTLLQDVNRFVDLLFFFSVYGKNLNTAFNHKVADWSILVSLSYRVVTEPVMEIQYILSPFVSRI